MFPELPDVFWGSQFMKKIKTEKKENDNNTAQTKQLYSIKELVIHIGATEWFWRTQIWEGALPYIQFNKKIFVDSKDLDVFIDSKRHQNG